ncbi:MAG TPA: nuclear transport factor 2 family protein [Gaiellaceae bacterium]
MNLPPVLARFVDASNARDVDAFLTCFDTDAVVEDEGRTHRGLAALRGWKQETQDRFHYTIEPTGLD